MSTEDAARYNGYFDEVLNSAVNKADDALNSINKWVDKKVYDLSDGLGLIPELVGVGKIPYEAPENIKPVENLISKMSGYKGEADPKKDPKKIKDILNGGLDVNESMEWLY